MVSACGKNPHLSILLQKNRPQEEAVWNPDFFLLFAFRSLPSRAKESTPGPRSTNREALPFPFAGEGLGTKKERDFYRGIMPTITAKIMHRMENTQT